MIEILKLSDLDTTKDQKLQQILQRTSGLTDEVIANTQTIVNAIKHSGDEALLDYTARFDGVQLTPETMRAPRELIEALAAQVNADLLAAMREAIANIRFYHEHQLTKSWEIERANGVRLGQRVSPLEIVGLYVPGGKAAYPSTLMMNALPAQVAGVNRVVVVTPPAQFAQAPIIAATLKELGLFEVYLIGGAQAVAALAYGTVTIPRVDKIVGPGNQFVAAAKKLVYGDVDIDSIAGPSEIVVIADDTARPDFIAADLLSQAEHSEDAAAILVTNSEALAAKVQAEIIRQTESLPRRAIIEKSLADFGALIVVESLAAACLLVNRLAAEHV
jgi:histidinol dehydrogenase